jgi:hypothetical protein
MAIRALSNTDLPFTITEWSSNTHLDNHYFNLLAISLDTILYSTLQQEISWRSLIEYELSHFGIRKIFVSLRVVRKYPYSNQEFAASKISSPQRDPNLW